MERHEPAEPQELALLGKLHFMSAGQGFLLLEVSALFKRVGEAQGCCSPTPREGAWLASLTAGSSAGEA